MNPDAVTSAHNARVARVDALLRDARRRRKEGLAVAEGEDLIEAAARAGAEIVEILVDADRPPQGAEWRAATHRTPTIDIAGPALARLSALGHPPRAIAVIRRPEQPPLDEVPPRAVVLHGVADPANVGALLRTAAAFEVPAVALTPGCADPFGPKALRAAMGATFTQGLCRPHSEIDRLLALRNRPPLVAAVATGGVNPAELPPTAVILLGAERAGLPGDVAGSCDLRVTIPAQGFASLNVAAAGAVLMYELARR